MFWLSIVKEKHTLFILFHIIFTMGDITVILYVHVYKLLMSRSKQEHWQFCIWLYEKKNRIKGFCWSISPP